MFYSMSWKRVSIPVYCTYILWKHPLVVYYKNDGDVDLAEVMIQNLNSLNQCNHLKERTFQSAYILIDYLAASDCLHNILLQATHICISLSWLTLSSIAYVMSLSYSRKVTTADFTLMNLMANQCGPYKVMWES